MDLGGRDPAQLVAAYASRYRAQYSDDDIRAALRGQGFAPEAIEDGLRLAGPREGPPATQVPEPAAPAPGRSLFKKLLIGAGALAALAVLAVAALIVFVPSKGKRAKRPLPPELAAYKPAKLAEPAHLAAFLPEGLEDADAGEEYARLIAGRVGALREPGGRERLKSQGLSAAEAQLLESALRKSRCSIFGVHLAPQDLGEYLLYTAAAASLVPAVTAHLRGPVKPAQEAKDWAAMKAHARRVALFGWHMTQDWHTPTQLLGSTVLTGGIMQQSVARKLEKGGEYADIEAAKATMDLLAYVGEDDVYGAIVQDAVRPDRLAGLATRLEDPRARRPYAAWTLQFAAMAFTPEEAQAAAAAPQRAAFLEGYARDPDPRMAALGAAHGRLLRDVEREYQSVPPERRGELHEKISRRLAGMSKRRE